MFSAYLSERNVSVCCVTEHWASDDILQRINLPNYIVAESFSREAGKYGGVAIILKEKIQFEKIPSLKLLSKEGHAEVSGVRVTDRNLIVIGIYRPPRGNFECFLSILNESLNQVQSTDHSPVCVLGDFNVDFLKESKDRRELIELLRSYGLSVVFDEPSRVTSSSRTCIDNIVTNFEDSTYRFEVTEPYLSDHMAQEIVLDHVEPERVERVVVKHVISDENVEKFCECLSNIVWGNLKNEDAEKYYENFHDEFQRNFDMCFPKVTIQSGHSPSRPRTKSDLDGLKRAVDAAQTIHQVKKDKPSYELLSILKQALRNSYGNAKKIRSARFVEAAENKSKAIWELIRRNTGKSRQNVENKSSLTSDEMNDFFAGVGETVSAQCASSEEEAKRLLKFHRVSSPTYKSLFLRPVSLEELTKIVFEFQK